VKALDRVFAPQWAGGWALARVLYGFAALVTHGRRGWGLADAYASADMVFSAPPFYFNDLVQLSLPTAVAVWVGGLVGAGLVIAGGRTAKLGVVGFLICSWILLMSEALNIKAYDRLITWIAFGLLLAPIGERGLADRYRSPVARYWILLVYCAMYGSTGLNKLLFEPRWWTGEVLGYHLVHQYFGLEPLGVWLSDQVWFTAPASWITVVAEVAFPLAIAFRRPGLVVLVALLGMHAGLLVLMDVGTFSLVAPSMFPVLLRPDYARELYERYVAGWRAR